MVPIDWVTFGSCGSIGNHDSLNKNCSQIVFFSRAFEPKPEQNLPPNTPPLFISRLILTGNFRTAINEPYVVLTSCVATPVRIAIPSRPVTLYLDAV